MRFMPGLLVITVVTTIVGCGRDPAPSASSAPPPTSRPAPAEARPWPGLVWTSDRFDPAPGAPNRRLVAVASRGSEVVAVGYDEGPIRNGVAMSAGEMLEFTPANNVDIFAGVELIDVTDTPHGFAAIGTELGGPEEVSSRVAVFTSVDGRTWRRVPGLPLFAGAHAIAIAHGPGGLLAIGASEDGIEQPIWRSVDGTDWLRHSTTEIGLPVEGLASLEGSPARWLATTGAADGAVIADSLDGRNWHATELPSTGGKGRKPPILQRAVEGRWGWIATGFEPVACGFLIWEGDCPAVPVSWWSDGLGDWGMLPEDSFPVRNPSARIVAAGDRGLVGVTGSEAWSSVDGLAWVPLASPGEAAVSVGDVVVVGDRIIAVGEASSNDGGSSEGWIGVAGECCN